MAEYSKLITTKKGEALIAKVLTGAADVINFTSIVTSSAEYELSELGNLSELTDIQQTSLISSKEIMNDVAIKLQAAFINTELKNGYYVRTLGLLADDPDEGSVLFAVTKETTGNCYMPAYNGVTVSGMSISMITTVSNAENVNLEIDPAAIATANDIENVRNEIKNHTAAMIYSEKGVHGFRYFNNELQVQDKEGNWVNAKPKELISTLNKGSTSLTFTDESITSSSTIDVYASVYGVSPKNASISENTLTLTFKAQTTNVDVKVVIS